MVKTVSETMEEHWLAHSHAQPISLLRPGPPAQGMVLPTVRWALQHQWTIKTGPPRHAHRPVWFGQSLHWDSFLGWLYKAESRRKNQTQHSENKDAPFEPTIWSFHSAVVSVCWWALLDTYCGTCHGVHLSWCCPTFFSNSRWKHSVDVMCHSQASVIVASLQTPQPAE